ncbi:Tad domain-containing protein [Fretibacter rubidus]|uniref:Tad domain-containing protein n=1 Tax=Fretibacter rubidus TaxID=570162 RepID=UPI00352AC3D7
MTNFDKIKALTTRYRDDEGGTMAIAYSVSLLTIIMAIGASYDLAMVSNANHKAQNVADSAALTAAVFVAKHDRAPASNTEGYMDKVYYDARGEGHKFSKSVHSSNLPGAPKVKVEYDFTNGFATATVEGKTSPAFLRILGRTELVFKEQSKVAFLETGYKSPASVFVAVDGSGSMAWDDRRDTDDSDDETSSTSTTPDAEPRVTGLKKSLKAFMAELGNIPGETNQVLRTGMYVYTQNYESSRSDTAKWGTLSTANNGKIDRLYASGGTNASKAMKEIRQKMATENTTHYNRNGNNTPLKFVILMTDGVNSPTGTTNCRNESQPAHKHWEYSYTETWTNRRGQRRSRTYSDKSESRFKPDNYYPWVQVDVPANSETKWVCDDVSTHDQTTKDECDTLAAQGATIYTIAYGLEAGYYHKRDGYFEPYREANGFIYDGYHIKLPETTRDRAYGVMEYCATVGGGTFVPAEDALQLTEAFQTIGEEIVEEVIRITN